MNASISRISTLRRHGLGLLLALGAGLAMAQPMARPDGPPPGMHAMGMHGGHGMMMGRALDAVGATADQKTRIAAIMKIAHDDLAKQREAGKGLHQQMQALLAAPTLDASAVEAVRQKMLAQHDAASRRRMQAMLDAAAVLTADQRAKLAELMKKRMDMAQRHRAERESLNPQHKQ